MGSSPIAPTTFTFCAGQIPGQVVETIDRAGCPLTGWPDFCRHSPGLALSRDWTESSRASSPLYLPVHKFVDDFVIDPIVKFAVVEEHEERPAHVLYQLRKSALNFPKRNFHFAV